jgi:hypothetical protein
MAHRHRDHTSVQAEGRPSPRNEAKETAVFETPEFAWAISQGSQLALAVELTSVSLGSLPGEQQPYLDLARGRAL